MDSLKKFDIRKGDMQNLPTEMEMDVLYFGISSQENGVSAMCVDGKVWPSKEYVDNETIKIKEATSLNFGRGLKKTIDNDGVTVSIDTDFLKEYIKLYVESEGGVLKYDVLKKASNYVLNDEVNAWYDLENANKGIIRFDEPSTAPSGTHEPNFGSHYIPSYTIELSENLSLDATPVLNFEGFAFHECPMNFKFIDANGKCSNPIAVGRIDNADKNTLVATANPITHQERKDTKDNIVALAYGGYPNPTTHDAITTQVEKLVTEYDTYGTYASNKCCKVKVDLFTATGVMNSGTGVDNDGMEDALTYEEGFDRNNITKIMIQLVESYDKDTITWKERTKAFIFNKFEFLEK